MQLDIDLFVNLHSIASALFLFASDVSQATVDMRGLLVIAAVCSLLVSAYGGESACADCDITCRGGTDRQATAPVHLLGLCC